MPSTPYVRGTKTVRVTTARLRPGNAVLTAAPGRHGQRGLIPATSRSDSIVRTVARVEPTLIKTVRGHEVRSASRRDVDFDDGIDDGTYAPNLAAHQTWAVVADTVQS